MLYPVREDEWAHSEESESLAFKYNLVSCNRGYQYIKAMDYDHVIVFFQNPAPEEFLKWMANMPNMKDKLHFVVTKQLMTKLKRKYPQFGNGLIVTRLVNLPDTHEAFMNILKKCLTGEDLDRFKEVEKIIKDDDKSALKQWINDTNEKFDIQPYKTDEPGWENKLKRSEIPYHTYTSDLEDKTVNQYCKWLEKWSDDRKNVKITDKTDFYKERIIFTPLDLLIDMYELGPKNPEKLDIDKLYWNMMKALEKSADKLGFERLNLDKYGRYKYLWIYKHAFDHMSKEEFIKYSDKIGLSQFEQNVLER